MLKIRKKLAEKKEASKGIAKAGFTLIELLVVIAILAILVLLAAPRFLGYTKDANVAAMQADAKVLANAALVHNIDKESWPTSGKEGTIKFGDVTVKTKALDSTKNGLGNQVQTLKGEFKDYALVVEEEAKDIPVKGEEGAKVTLQAGDIVYIGKDKKGVSGVEDKDGDRHYAVNIEVDKGISVEITAPTP